MGAICRRRFFLAYEGLLLHTSIVANQWLFVGAVSFLPVKAPPSHSTLPSKILLLWLFVGEWLFVGGFSSAGGLLLLSVKGACAWVRRTLRAHRCSTVYTLSDLDEESFHQFRAVNRAKNLSIL